MDEPFASLDEQTRLLLGDKVLQIQQQLKQTTLLITHNITEAVQLRDRVLVMTYRPGRVKRIVDIDLPRPRTSEIVSAARASAHRSARSGTTCARKPAAACARTSRARATAREHARDDRAPLTRSRAAPALLGFGTLVVADRR